MIYTSLLYEKQTLVQRISQFKSFDTPEEDSKIKVVKPAKSIGPEAFPGSFWNSAWKYAPRQNPASALEKS
jgi:hypothetical protein